MHGSSCSGCLLAFFFLHILGLDRVLLPLSFRIRVRRVLNRLKDGAELDFERFRGNASLIKAFAGEFSLYSQFLCFCINLCC